MIENKVVTIVKENQFDKGWTLFIQHILNIPQNKDWHALSVAEIVSAITRCDSIDIILTEPCLSNSIVEELVWLNRYAPEIPINVVAKTDAVLSRYSTLSFTKITIDNDINFNYIGIKNGENSLYIVIDDDYVQVDDSIEKIYFEKNNSVKEKFSFLQNAKQVIIADIEGKKDYGELFAECLNRNIDTSYFVPTKFFSKEIFERIPKTVNLCVSNYLKNGILVVDKQGLLYCANQIMGGQYVLCKIKDVNYYIGRAYKSLQVLPEKAKKFESSSCLYTCYGGEIKQLEIADKKVIERQVKVATMEDFIGENFDSSETESHNDYSAEAKQVEYHYVLIPPLFDESCGLSNMYDAIIKQYSAWKNIKKFNLSMFKIAVGQIVEKSQLSSLCDKLEEYERWLDNAIGKTEYTGYHEKLNEYLSLLNEASANLIRYFVEILSIVNTQSSGEKFGQFDGEIDGYRQTIAEKQKLIDQGIEVLSNKRRIEVLERKIENLKQIKKEFEKGAEYREEKDRFAFLEKCNRIFDGTYKSATKTESISNVLQAFETDKTSMLEVLATEYLCQFRDYLTTCSNLIKELLLQDIPEDYKVYDRGGERFIAIDELSEYMQTETLQKKYKIKCLARR